MTILASRWWAKDVASKERWRHAQAYVRALETSQKPIYERLAKYAWLYDRNAQMGMVGGKMQNLPQSDPDTENIIKNNIETATALLGNEHNRVATLTDGAEWSVIRKAKKLQLFLEAQFKKLNWLQLQVKMVRSGCVAGNGYIKIEIEDNEIVANQVPFNRIIVDEVEWQAGCGTQMAQREFVNKDNLKARYPDFEKEIDAAHTKDANWTNWSRLEPTQIAVIESWRLPLRKGSKDGRHCITIDGATLLDEVYTKDYFPFVIFRWVDRLAGFLGCGIAEELAPYQLIVNETNRDIRKSHEVFGSQKIFVHYSDIAAVTQKWDDDPRGILPYKTQPPVVPQWQAHKPEIYAFKENVKNDAQKYSGIPDMSARSMKPAGLDSGAAIREWTDVGASRITTQKVQIENIQLQAALIIIDLAKELYGQKQKQNIKATWHSRNLAKTIKWSDVDMEADMYVLRIEPASYLSRTPAGVRDLVSDLARMGTLKPDDILRMMGIPDTQRALDIATAAIETIEAEIEELSEGNWRPPEPFMDLVNGIPRVNSAMQMARDQGAPPDILQGFMDWIVRAKAILDSQTPGPQSAPNQVATVPGQLGLAAPAGPINKPE